MARLEVSRATKRDLLEIGRYTLERWGQEQCRLYLAQLDTRMRSLAANPSQGRACDSIQPGYWLSREGRHVIFSKLGPRNSVRVIRILHDQMLPKHHL